MANKKVAQPKRIKTEKAYEYEQNYINKNVKFITVPFNQKHDDERQLYEWLKEQRETGKIKSVGGFIKDFLLREMMKKE